MNPNIKLYKYKILFMVFCFCSCTKFVQVPPPVTEVTGATAYSNNVSAAAVMTGLYSRIMGASGFIADGPYSIGTICGTSADELKNYSNADPVFSLYYTNSANSQNAIFWSQIYQWIYITNSVIEGLAGSTGVTPSMRLQLNGEAKFMRAFLYFYAVNLFGDVPLATTTTYLTNNSIQRTPKAQVWQQIIADLKDAVNDLNDNYLDGFGDITTERVRPNKGAAQALLARVYLYNGDWPDAKIQSDSVINNSTNYSLQTDLTQVFLANNTEAVWQLQPVAKGYNTYDGYYFILTSPPGTGRFNVDLSSNLLSAFEPNDARYSNWVDSLIVDTVTYYYPYKYKVGQRNQPLTEYLMVLRLAEQYLIRAEAEAYGAGQGIPAAVQDLNTIRSRANLPPYSGGMDQGSVLSAILHERQVELFTEWGQRWLDLKRTGNVDAVMSVVTPLKGGNWMATDSLYPIPQSDILIDPGLQQTPGYN